MTRWQRALLWTVVIVVAVVVLFTWVFPWVESQQQNPTLGTTVVATGDDQLVRSPR